MDWILGHIDASTVMAVIFGVLWRISDNLGKSKKFIPNGTIDFAITFITGGFAAVKAKAGEPGFVAEKAIEMLTPSAEKALNEAIDGHCSPTLLAPITPQQEEVLHAALANSIAPVPDDFPSHKADG